MARFWQLHRAAILLGVLAVAFYWAGYRKGSLIAVAIGVGLEIAFWLRLTRRHGDGGGPAGERGRGDQHRP